MRIAAQIAIVTQTASSAVSQTAGLHRELWWKAVRYCLAVTTGERERTPLRRSPEKRAPRSQASAASRARMVLQY